MNFNKSWIYSNLIETWFSLNQIKDDKTTKIEMTLFVSSKLTFSKYLWCLNLPLLVVCYLILWPSNLIAPSHICYAYNLYNSKATLLNYIIPLWSNSIPYRELQKSPVFLQATVPVPLFGSQEYMKNVIFDVYNIIA